MADSDRFIGIIKCIWVLILLCMMRMLLLAGLLCLTMFSSCLLFFTYNGSSSNLFVTVSEWTLTGIFNLLRGLTLASRDFPLRNSSRTSLALFFQVGVGLVRHWLGRFWHGGEGQWQRAGESSWDGGRSWTWRCSTWVSGLYPNLKVRVCHPLSTINKRINKKRHKIKLNQRINMKNQHV